MSRRHSGKTSWFAFIFWTAYLWSLLIYFIFPIFDIHPAKTCTDSEKLLSYFWPSFFCFLPYLFVLAFEYFGTQIVFNVLFANDPGYEEWKAAGGNWGIDYWTFDPYRVKVAIGQPPETDNCTYCGHVLGETFGNVCLGCGKRGDIWDDEAAAGLKPYWEAPRVGENMPWFALIMLFLLPFWKIWLAPIPVYYLLIHKSWNVFLRIFLAYVYAKFWGEMMINMLIG